MLQGQQGRGVRPAAHGADLAAFRHRRCRAHPRPGALGPAPRDDQPELARQPQIPGDRLRRSPLWPADPGTLDSVPNITVADMKDYVGRVLAKDTLKIAVVGDVDPATLGKLLDQTFGSLPAKASLTPVARRRGGKAAAARLHAARRAADRDHVRRPRREAQRSEFHGGLCRQPHPRRRRIVLAALSRSAREARAGLFGVRSAALDGAFGGVHRQHRHPRRSCRRDHRCDREGVRRIAEEGPTQKELDEAKSYLKGSQMLALDTSSKLAQAMLQYQRTSCRSTISRSATPSSMR